MQPSIPELSELPLLREKSRAVEELVSRYREEPAALLTLLVELGRLFGPLPKSAAHYLAARLDLRPDEVEAFAAAHGLLRGEPEPHRLGVCSGGACAARGGNEVERVLREKGVGFDELRCQGSCDLGPIACYNRGAPLAISAARARTLAKADPSDWEDLLSVEKPVHAFKTEPRVVFANIFAKGSHQLATARRHGVYAPVEAALKEPGERLLEPVGESGLLGAGGEAEPVVERWRRIRAEPPGPRTLVVNGVESEPGTFKDRVLLERDPHLVISGALLAAHAVGASEIYFCVRAEYELAIERLRGAVEEAQRAGLLGPRVAGTDQSIIARVRLAPGSYRAGEAAGLVQALEGRIAPGTSGTSAGPGEEAASLRLLGRPAIVHNPETLAALPAIAANGGAWYREQGLDGAVGTKILCLSGDVKRAGNYEVQRGASLRDLVERLGSGTLQGQQVLALQIGGAREPLLPPSSLELKYDDASLQTAGARIGSGALVVLSERTCLWDYVRRQLAFFAREGCGQCRGCRELIPALRAELETLVPEPQAATRVQALAATDGAGCAVSRRAALPLFSLAASFPEAVRDHREGSCACNPKRKKATTDA